MQNKVGSLKEKVHEGISECMYVHKEKYREDKMMIVREEEVVITIEHCVLYR